MRVITSADVQIYAQNQVKSSAAWPSGSERRSYDGHDRKAVGYFFVFKICIINDPSFQILNTSSMLTKHNCAMGFTAVEPLS